jgi:hypothetical protein
MMINFKLKNIDKIHPFGAAESPSLSWFGLTDADLSIELGKSTIFEYTKESRTQNFYNDYYLSRFIEDFTSLFERINESIPDSLYSIVSSFETIDLYLNQANQLLEKNHSDEFFDKYEKSTSWIHDRCLTSGHLIGGPLIWFIRKEQLIKIIWKSDYKLDNGVNLWTAGNGQIEMNYSKFVTDIEFFLDSFSKEMDKQVEQSLLKDWENIRIDKVNLKKEHTERKNEFYQLLNKLKASEKTDTNWNQIENSIREIK